MEYHNRRRVPVRRHNGEHWWKNLHVAPFIRILLVPIIIALIAYPFAAAKILTVEKLTFTSSNLPPEINKLKIAFISDIHYGFWYGSGELSELVSRVNAMNPDLIILGGDYATDCESAVSFFEQLPQLHSRYGIYAVLGDADYKNSDESGSDINRLRRTMMTHGVTSLVNETATVRIGTKSILIAGADYVVPGYEDVTAVSSAVTGSDYVIFAAHSPATIDAALSATSSDGVHQWFDLGLFGHTHGGQMGIFGQHPDTVALNDRYRSGHWQENHIDMVVSNGVGTTELPMRIGVPAQIQLITVNYSRN